MPLTAEGLLDEVLLEIGEPKVGFKPTDEGYAAALEEAKKVQKAAYEPMCKAFINYLKANTVVNVTVTSVLPPTNGFGNGAGPATGSVTTTGTIS